jgi:hypothetical protein
VRVWLAQEWVIRGARKNWFLYKDTVLQESILGGKFGIAQAKNNIRIGKHFLGKIDDVRFCHRSLGSNEMEQIFKLSSSCQVTKAKDIGRHVRSNAFPNPFHSTFSLSLNNSTGPNSISVFDLTGIEHFKDIFSGNHTTLDLCSLQSGYYLIAIHTNGMMERCVIEKVFIINFTHRFQ